MDSKRLYLQRRRRRTLILQAAVGCARLPGGWASLTRAQIALRAACSPALVSRCMGNMDAVRKAIMRVAVRQNLTTILSASRAMHDGYAPPRK